MFEIFKTIPLEDNPNSQHINSQEKIIQTNKTTSDKKISYNNLEYKYNDVAQKCELINPTNQCRTALRELEVNDILKFFWEMTKSGVSISK